MEQRYCEYCGKDIRNDAVFCPYCGSNPVVVYGTAEAQPSPKLVNPSPDKDPVRDLRQARRYALLFPFFLC